MRAAIYLRISQDHAGEGLGVTRQLEDCTDLAQSLGWDILDVYQDNDVSATSSKPRPAYRRLLQSIIDDEIDAVVCWHADRLYRKMGDLEELLEIVRPRGTKVATVKAGNIDLSSDSGQMIAEILASVAGYEGRAKATRWKRSVRQRRERGDQPGMGPRLYGYNRDGTINDDERAHVLALIDDLLDGVPIIRATHRLNDRGAQTTLGNQWSRPSVAKYLRNGRIAGRSTLNGDTLGRGTWPPLLNEETFEQLQLVLDARRGTVTQRPRVALLLGLAHCGLCNHKLVTGGRTGGVRIYRCSTMPATGGCGRISITAESVEEIVEEYVRERLSDPRVTARLTELSATTTGNLAELVDLEQRLSELEAELDAPGVPVTAILRAMDRTRVRIEELRTQTSAIPRAALTGDWPADLPRRIRLVQLVVETVTINPGPAIHGAIDPARVVITDR